MRRYIANPMTALVIGGIILWTMQANPNSTLLGMWVGALVGFCFAVVCIGKE
jgi:F0F1-type ATP synthase assembly protein I